MIGCLHKGNRAPWNIRETGGIHDGNNVVHYASICALIASWCCSASQWNRGECFEVLLALKYQTPRADLSLVVSLKAFHY